MNEIEQQKKLAEEYMVRCVSELRDRFGHVPKEEWDDVTITLLHTLCELTCTSQNFELFVELLHEVLALTTVCDRFWIQRAPLQVLKMSAEMALKTVSGKEAGELAVNVLHDVVHVARDTRQSHRMVYDVAHDILHAAKTQQVVHPMIASGSIILSSTI
jgi:hypothetical protein